MVTTTGHYSDDEWVEIFASIRFLRFGFLNNFIFPFKNNYTKTIFCLYKNMNALLNFHFRLWFIVLTVLVCFGSNQCPVSIPECNAMYALQSSLNLPGSISNNGSNQTNPCSKKWSKSSSKLCFVWFPIYGSKKTRFLLNRLARSELQFLTKSRPPNQMARTRTRWNHLCWSWEFNCFDTTVKYILSTCFHIVFILVISLPTIWMDQFPLKLDWCLHFNGCENKNQKKRNERFIKIFFFYLLFVFLSF